MTEDIIDPIDHPAAEKAAYAAAWESDYPAPKDPVKTEADRQSAEVKSEYREAWDAADNGAGVTTAPVPMSSTMQTTTLDPLPEAPDLKVTPDPVKAMPVSVPSAVTAKPLAPLPKPATFGSAFAQARRAGLSQFEWQGKRYTTQTKEEAARKASTMPKSVTTAAAPATPVLPKVSSAPVASAAPAPLRPAAIPAAASQVTQPMSITTSARTTAKPMTYFEEKQQAYDDWMAAKSANRTWYGGTAQGSPTSKQREIEAERRYTELLRNPR